jgi:pyridinium-3,5-biscarboxylic acid mononucleotide synthase
MSDIQIDFDREDRQGFAEVVYGEGKSKEQLLEIVRIYSDASAPVLVTRLSSTKARAMEEAFLTGTVERSHEGGTLSWRPEGQKKPELPGPVALVSAGSSDQRYLEEAEVTLHYFGAPSFRICDSGVAGIHRLLKREADLHRAKVCIVVAGMDGALPSVVGGLVGCPVIAVPTSVGYGASFGGLSALLTMLNSCASGVSVVNIDNGYGAAMSAIRILKGHST